MNFKKMMKKFDALDPSMIQDEKLRKQAIKIKGQRKQGGFTLLELLVVVAILAAIAGTAAIALQDTDARASAAAHVAMMDELDKGIRTYRVLQKNAYPDNFDSIMQAASTETITTTGTITTGTEQLDLAVHEDLQVLDLSLVSGDVLGRLTDIGITKLRVATTEAGTGAINNPDGDGDCADHEALVASRANAVVAGNIFMSPAANGCGASHELTAASNVMVWGGGTERVNGQFVENDFAPTAAVTVGDAAGATEGTPVYMAVGIGPSTTLFNKANLGSMTTVPVYRHVAETKYNRFTALFHIANTGDFGGTGTFNAVDQVLLTAIVDGAGDTKEEELGEWDGTRNTI